MFKNKKASVINPNTTDTLIGEGSVFEGKIKSQAGIRIEGQINGDVECSGDVTIGERGVVKSNITARNIIIAGIVHGNVTAKESLRLMTTGQLFGNTATQTMTIDEGAVFQGTSRMEKITPGEKSKKADPAAAAASSNGTVAAFPSPPSAPAFHQETGDSYVSR
jgi:cytoskeletal protein CcmA (bactofilin family)